MLAGETEGQLSPEVEIIVVRDRHATPPATDTCHVCALQKIYGKYLQWLVLLTAHMYGSIRMHDWEVTHEENNRFCG
jgi:hypothetical protein